LTDILAGKIEGMEQKEGQKTVPRWKARREAAQAEPLRLQRVAMQRRGTAHSALLLGVQQPQPAAV
jgi:hypothetical protein